MIFNLLSDPTDPTDPPKNKIIINITDIDNNGTIGRSDRSYKSDNKENCKDNVKNLDTRTR